MRFTNKYKVSLRQWKKWSPLARRVFNCTYEGLKDQSTINTSPGAKQLSPKEWAVVRWNAAFIAATDGMTNWGQ